ncbi:hypothetical protein IG611_16520 [Pectobacterium sp. A535-S3-A17]|uniref:hypothetical protein n=1 Tax=Pectobacterium quasiaquaticum TaxID=2774015 RepID=UPI0018748D45|nr:hypothetical protein [Pectobacterium quasiaquaticum]MBE5215997.1 hypothetical protein [Pectobacterium quasiaquaticum]MBE5226948.1 hypothetical protein [Pectobacterium quasiaquaticum]
MTEDNVVSFRAAKLKRKEANRNDLEIARTYTKKPLKPKAVVDEIKKRLKAKGIRYRASFSSCDLTGFDKKCVVIFPEAKLIIEFITKPTTHKKVDGWVVEQLVCSEKIQLVEYIDFITKKILEVNQHG